LLTGSIFTYSAPGPFDEFADKGGKWCIFFAHLTEQLCIGLLENGVRFFFQLRQINHDVIVPPFVVNRKVGFHDSLGSDGSG